MARFSAFQLGLSKFGMVLALGATTGGLSSRAWALDEYLPLAPRVMEIDLGFERSAVNGYFDESWERVENVADKNPSAMPIQGKFGLIDGLEGSMAVNFITLDVDGKTGFDRPILGLKYADTCLHLGGFLGIALPIGFEDVMNGGNYASMIFGAMYGLDLPYYRLLANISYTFNTEDEAENKMDQLHFFAKPEYPLPIKALTARKQYLGAYLGLNYDFYFNAVAASESVDTKKHLFSIMPGLNYTFNRIISSELTVSYPLTGKNADDVTTVRLQVYFTLEEAIYNALGG